MKKICCELKIFFQDKLYMLFLCLPAVCAYGFTVTHYAIGMDDTAVSMYFEDGLAPYMGRWGLFLLGKIINIGNFVPWMTELVSIMVLMVSVTLWCVLWKRICEPKAVIPIWCYGLVAGIFISCPIISEVFVFYLHNGICIGYGVSALALYAFVSGMQRNVALKERILKILFSMLLLTVSIGFYESFALVYIMGAVLLFGLIRVFYRDGRKNCAYEDRFCVWLSSGIVAAGGALLIRTAMTSLFEAVFGLDKFSIYNMRYYHFFGDLLSNPSDLFMVVKRFYVKYYVNAVTYLPITVLVAVLALLGINALYFGVKKKDIFLPLCFAALVIFPVLMSLVEGLTTRYRSAQYVPMMCAFGVLVLLLLLYTGNVRRHLNTVCVALLGVLLFNQCADMNKWFYLDWLKYQYAREVMSHVAYDLKREYDTSKPIVFCGGLAVPYSISADAYVSYSSWQYRAISALTDPIDVHLKEKYHNGSHGYVSPESPIISILAWGVTAFDATSGQLIKFCEMQGIEGLRCETDKKKINEAGQLCKEENMPAYPKQGYILECEDYVIVNLAE